jgi:hypothetical protein
VYNFVTGYNNILSIRRQSSVNEQAGLSQSCWLCKNPGVTPAASGGKKRFWGMFGK